MAIRVSSYMTSPVITARPTDTLAHIRNLMLRHKIGRIVITQGEKPIGIVTKTDFVKVLSLRRKRYRPLDDITASEVMNRELIVIERNRSIKTAAKIMIRHNISGLPVIDSRGKLAGIITLTDIVRAYSENFQGKLKVGQVMRTKPTTVKPLHSLYHVIEALSKDEAKKVIVVDGNRPVGIITQSDIVFLSIPLTLTYRDKIIKKTVILEKGRATTIRFYMMPVASDIMTPNPLTIGPFEDLALAAETMIKNNISCLPVVDEESNLLGIVTKLEVAKGITKV